MNSKKIIIIGTGGNCIDILDTILTINDHQKNTHYEVLGFLDDDISKANWQFSGYSVIGTLADAQSYTDAFFIFGVGSLRNFYKRSYIFHGMGLPLDRLETIIHPSAEVSRFAKVGKGSVIFQNVSITSNVDLGDCVMILPNSVVSHDVKVGSFTCIAGGVCISGNAVIGECCYLGTNASLISGAKIGDQALVGMGAVVLNDVESRTVVVGNPATYLKHVEL